MTPTLRRGSLSQTDPRMFTADRLQWQSTPSAGTIKSARDESALQRNPGTLDPKLQLGTDQKSSTCTIGKLPSMAWIPASMPE